MTKIRLICPMCGAMRRVLNWCTRWPGRVSEPLRKASSVLGDGVPRCAAVRRPLPTARCPLAGEVVAGGRLPLGHR